MIDHSTWPPTLKLDPPNDGWTWVAYSHVLRLASAPDFDHESRALYDQLSHAILEEDLNPRAGRP